MNTPRPPPRPPPAPILNGLSVDVEEYFQVHALAAQHPRCTWDTRESRVEASTDRLLQIFSDADLAATFFVLGWVAERHPALVRRIAEAGHEVASHGYDHVRVDAQSAEAFRTDVRESRQILEDTAGVAVRGYRAASFSVGSRTPWAWRVLEEEGYAYSSSVHHASAGQAIEPSLTPYSPGGADRLVEVPVTSLRWAGADWPCGGGGWFRLLPYAVTRAALSHVNRRQARAAVFYIHPWEIDPGQPRTAGASVKSRLRHYLNLAKTEARLQRLTRDFRWDRIDRIIGLAPLTSAIQGSGAGAVAHELLQTAGTIA